MKQIDGSQSSCGEGFENFINLDAVLILHVEMTLRSQVERPILGPREWYQTMQFEGFEARSFGHYFGKIMYHTVLM
jgi:hypothetical protein